MVLTNCCFCIGLRTGSLIFTVISGLNCLSAFIHNLSNGESDLIIYGSGVFVSISCIYAIVEKKAVLMLPELIWLMILVVYLLIYYIVMIVNYVVKKKELGGYNPDPDTDPEIWKTVDFIFIVICIFHSLVTAIYIYFWCVVFALYKEFKRERSDSENNENVV